MKIQIHRLIEEFHHFYSFAHFFKINRTKFLVSAIQPWFRNLKFISAIRGSSFASGRPGCWVGPRQKAAGTRSNPVSNGIGYPPHGLIPELAVSAPPPASGAREPRTPVGVKGPWTVNPTYKTGALEAHPTAEKYPYQEIYEKSLS